MTRNSTNSPRDSDDYDFVRDFAATGYSQYELRPPVQALKPCPATAPARTHKSKAPKFICDSLSCLTYRLKPSGPTFKVPEEGFGQLSKLVDNIAQEIEESGCDKTDDFNAERKLFNHIFEILHHDQTLGLRTSVFRQFTQVGRGIVLGIAAQAWDTLIDCLVQGASLDCPAQAASLDRVLVILRKSNSELKDMLREHLLDSAAFWDIDVLMRVPLSGNCVELGLIHDAALRARNLALRPERMALIGPDSGLYACTCNRNAYEQDEEFLQFPGTLDDIPIMPLISISGVCNIVRTDWVVSQGLGHKIDRDPQRAKVLLMADGTTLGGLPVIDVRWSFDGRNKTWSDIEFVVIDDYEHDALIGKNFLKKTETVHTKGGKMIFPELAGFGAGREAVPVYEFGTSSG